jgi:hypothetical protein
MYIFILSVLVVSFVSLCFFKKKFWENRYLVLFISGCVAIVATLTTNYATRGKIGTRVETLWEYPIQTMALNDSLIDNSAFTIDEELSFDDHLMMGDTTIVTKYSHYLFYYNEGLKIGYAVNNNMKSRDLNCIYIASSNSDSLAYLTKQRVYYKSRESKWVTDFSLPYIKTIRCLYLPPIEYVAIPDSLIRKPPFEL